VAGFTKKRWLLFLAFQCGLLAMLVVGQLWVDGHVGWWAVPTLLALGIGLFKMTIVVDRSNTQSRRRKSGKCVSCGYDLTGNVSGVCPECGTAVEPHTDRAGKR